MTRQRVKLICVCPPGASLAERARAKALSVALTAIVNLKLTRRVAKAWAEGKIEREGQK